MDIRTPSKVARVPVVWKEARIHSSSCQRTNSQRRRVSLVGRCSLPEVRQGLPRPIWKMVWGNTDIWSFHPHCSSLPLPTIWNKFWKTVSFNINKFVMVIVENTILFQTEWLIPWNQIGHAQLQLSKWKNQNIYSSEYVDTWGLWKSHSWLGLAILDDCSHFLHFWLFVRPPPARSVGNLATWIRKAEGANIV